MQGSLNNVTSHCLAYALLHGGLASLRLFLFTWEAPIVGCRLISDLAAFLSEKLVGEDRKN